MGARSVGWPRVVAALAVVAAIGLGTVLRLADPLSSPVMAAEDPYTHMALVREHLRTGGMDPLNPHENVYPPGLHAFIAAAWVYTGSDLYSLMLYGPVVFGAIGIAGLAMLLWRGAGPVAAVVGALALAVMPEAIFRSNMMSPTALDLAVLPAFLYALLRILAGRVGWVGVAAPMAVFLAIAHPWLLAILCSAGGVFLVAALLLPWATTSRSPPLTVAGVAGAIAVLGVGLGAALMVPGFGDTLKLPGSAGLARVGLAAIGLSLVPAAILLRWRDRARADAWLARGPPHVLVRAGLSVLIAAGLAATLALARRGGLPAFVDPQGMFGWPVMALAALALVALPFLASPLANLGAALSAVTLPFMLFNFLHSEFLPHRTAIFVGFALAILCGVAAAGLARLATRLWGAASSALSRPRIAGRPAGAKWLVTAPALLVAALLSGSIYTGTPDGYEGGWYRLYNECELDALRDISAQADADPGLLIMTGSWQSKLVLAALTEDASRVWFTGGMYTSQDTRDQFVAQMDREGRPIVLVVERHLRDVTPEADMWFTDLEPWQPAGAWCANQGLPQPRVIAYTTGTPEASP